MLRIFNAHFVYIKHDRRFMAFKLEADEFSNRKHWLSLIKNKFSFVKIFFIYISLWKRVKK